MHPKIAVTALLLPALAYSSPVKVGGVSVKCPKLTAPSVPVPNKLDCILALTEDIALGGLLSNSGSATVNTCTITYAVTGATSVVSSLLKSYVSAAISAINSACGVLDGTYIPVPGVSVTIGASASA